MKIYHKIWQTNFGIIPIDEFGRSYEIHHIDGNHHNNDLNNLKCISIQEHYDIHYAQGNYYACNKILLRMNLDQLEFKKLCSETTSKFNKQRVELGIHNWQNSKNATLKNLKRIADKTHPFLGEIGSKMATERNKKFLKEGRHQSQKFHFCVNCQKMIKSTTAFNRWHGEKCKSLY